MNITNAKEEKLSEEVKAGLENDTSMTSSEHRHHQEARNERLLCIRKVKSRNAARTRRGKENFEFYELAKLLPIPTETSSQLDKASIIRLTMTFLKMRQFAYSGNPPWNMKIEGPPPNRSIKDTSRSRSLPFTQMSLSKIFENQLGSHLLQSLDGFLFALNCQARFIYVSETISTCLGLSQVEMTGSSIFDYTHPADQGELAVQLGLTISSRKLAESLNSGSNNRSFTTRSFFIRMKSILSKRGVNLKSSSYKVIHLCTRARVTCTHIHKKKGFSLLGVKMRHKMDKEPTEKSDCVLGITGIGTTLLPPNVNDIRVNRPVFITRLNPSFKFTYCDIMVHNLLGYDVRDIVGCNLYHCIHAADLEKLKLCHSEVLNKGQAVTPYYRWLHKSGGYVWVYSSVSMLANQRLYPEQSFIWINYILSEQMEKKQVFDVLQLSTEEIKLHQNMHSKQYSKPTGKKEKMKEKPVEVSNDQVKTSEEHSDILFSKHDDVKETDSEKQVTAEHDSSIKLGPQEDVNNNAMKGRPPNCLNTKSDDGNSLVDKLHHDISAKNSKVNCDAVSGKISIKCTSLIVHDASAATVSKKTSSVEKCKSSNCIVEKLTRKRPHSCKKKNLHERCKKLILGNEDSHTLENNTTKKTNTLSETDESASAKQSSKSSQSISDYMDADSVVWSNPPNKEISNHNDLPPGIKQMHSLWAVRRTPSAVHHHYPFGINPALLHSNPVLAKIMMASWSGYPQQLTTKEAYLMTTPVQFMSPICISHPDSSHMKSLTVSSEVHTPASVAAVLEELKKDPLHKVSPPNKVVIPNIQGSESTISGSKDLLHSAPSVFISSSSSCNQEENVKRHPGSLEEHISPQCVDSFVAKRADGNNLSQDTNHDTALPHTLLAVNNKTNSNLIFNSTHSSILAVSPDAMLNLSIPSSTLQQQCSPYIIQPLTFPQVTKLPSFPL